MVSTVDTRTDKKGIKQPAHKPPRAPAEPPKARSISGTTTAAPARSALHALTNLVAAANKADPAMVVKLAADEDPDLIGEYLDLRKAIEASGQAAAVH